MQYGAGMTTMLPAVRDGSQAASDPLAALVLGWLAGKRSIHTRRAYGRDIAAWLSWCAEHGTDPLTASEPDAAGWARHMDAASLAGTTVARKLAAASSWYIWLNRNGHASSNPLEYLARPEVNRDTSSTPGLTRDQAIAMLTAVDQARSPRRARTAALIAVILFTGARVSEITAADIEDLGTDRGNRVLRVTRKGGMRQLLAVPPPAARRLDAYLASRGDMASLPAVTSQPGSPRPRRPLFASETGARLFPADVWQLVRRIGKAAGLPAELVSHLGPHALRHAFATLYLDAGGNLRDLQDAMGHSDPRTTRRYDRARYSLDRSPGYTLAGYLADTAAAGQLT
jgi:integrase/recombinase XerD